MRHERPAQQHRPEEINANGIDPFVPVDVLNRTLWAIDAVSVHQNMDPGEVIQRILNDPADIHVSGDIRRDSDHLLPNSGRRLNFCSGILQEIFVPGTQYEISSSLCIASCNDSSQTLVGTRDDGYPTV